MGCVKRLSLRPSNRISYIQKLEFNGKGSQEFYGEACHQNLTCETVHHLHVMPFKGFKFLFYFNSQQYYGYPFSPHGSHPLYPSPTSGLPHTICCMCP